MLKHKKVEGKTQLYSYGVEHLSVSPDGARPYVFDTVTQKVSTLKNKSYATGISDTSLRFFKTSSTSNNLSVMQWTYAGWKALTTGETE